MAKPPPEKTCPYCAETIQGAAIKCKHCNSWLDGRPQQTPQPGGLRRAVDRAATDGDQRKVLFEGHPAARAFFKHYVFIAIVGIGGPVLGYWVAGEFGLTTMYSAAAAAAVFMVAAVWFYGLRIYRRSIVFRVTTSNIESERGILRKRIDVLELWRCRDIRFQQSIMDRILGISSIVIFTADVTSPELIMRGMPGSRKLFEGIRDSIEIQRQSRNVLGMVE